MEEITEKTSCRLKDLLNSL